MGYMPAFVRLAPMSAIRHADVGETVYWTGRLVRTSGGVKSKVVPHRGMALSVWGSGVDSLEA